MAEPASWGGDVLVSVRGLALTCAACMNACATVHTCLCMSVGAGLRVSRERLLGLGLRPGACGGAGGREEGNGFSWGPVATGSRLRFLCLLAA